MFKKINCLADEDAFQQNIEKFMSWSYDWQLCFDASKCKVMHIGRKNIDGTYKFASVEGVLDLAEVDKACDLEVNFLSNLQFDKHVANICAKANRTVGIIKHTFSAQISTCLEFCQGLMMHGRNTH